MVVQLTPSVERWISHPVWFRVGLGGGVIVTSISVVETATVRTSWEVISWTSDVTVAVPEGGLDPRPSTASTSRVKAVFSARPDSRTERTPGPGVPWETSEGSSSVKPFSPGESDQDQRID